MLDQPSAAIVLEVGANDGLRGVNPDSTYGNLVELVGEVRKGQPGARYFWCKWRLLPISGVITPRDSTVSTSGLPTKTGITLLPFLLDGVAGNPRLNQGDGIHPNPAGSKIVAENMWRGLEQELRDLSSRGGAVTGAGMGAGIDSAKVPR